MDKLSLSQYTSGHEHDRFDKLISVSFGWHPLINDQGLIKGCSIFVFSCKDDFLTVSDMDYVSSKVSINPPQ